MTRWLVDAGPLVSYLDRADPFHERCAEALDEFAGELLTTDAVIVEAMHLLADVRNGPQALVDFLEKSETRVHERTQLPWLHKAAAMMRKFVDVPMDFADATLVLLAHETRIHHIATLDHRGFSTFRAAAGKRFQLVIER